MEIAAFRFPADPQPERKTKTATKTKVPSLPTKCPCLPLFPRARFTSNGAEGFYLPEPPGSIQNRRLGRVFLVFQRITNTWSRAILRLGTMRRLAHWRLLPRIALVSFGRASHTRGRALDRDE